MNKDLALWRMDGLDDISANPTETISRAIGTIDTVIATGNVHLMTNCTHEYAQGGNGRYKSL